MRTNDDRIRGFDGLRAIAFLMVFCSHKIQFAAADAIGNSGVWLFFVLSGFLITRILANARTNIERGLVTISDSLSHFYLRRTARIFPPYYLILIFFVVVSLFVPIAHFGRSEKISYFLYATNVFVSVRNWVGDFGHFWSLAIEEQFYLLFAPIVLWVPRKGTLTVCLAIIAMGLTTKVILETGGASAVSIDVNSLINFALLGFGGVIGLMEKRAAPKWLISGQMQIGILCLYLLLPAAFGTGLWFWPLFGKLSALLVGILLFQIFHTQQSWFVGVLESSPLRNIGRISYGAYLIHPFLHFSMLAVLLNRFDLVITIPRSLQILAELAASLILAAASWHHLERPIIAWAGRLTGRRVVTLADGASPPPSSPSRTPSQLN
jgi:peptidoglycan/LPS O-acetylase OafA/YrhL